MSKSNLVPRLVRPAPRLAALFCIALTAAGASAQEPDRVVQSLAAFEHATQDYVLMHRRLERQIGTFELSTPIAEVNRMIHDLAVAIRAERGDARQGDVFTPELTHLLRTRINHALLEHHYVADDVRAAGRLNGSHYERVRLQVNDTFPWALAAGMFPCVIDALPSLPPELQYRIVGDDLLLIDIHASLIVDILPQALIDLTMRDRSPYRDPR